MGCLLLESIYHGILHLTMIAIVELFLFGLLPVFDISLNPITFANSIVTIGISTEFFINMIRSILQRQNESYQPQSFNLFGPIASSLSFSAVCSTLGLIVLHFADTPIISLYFFVVYVMIISMSYIIAMTLLPSVMLLSFRISLACRKKKRTPPSSMIPLEFGLDDDDNDELEMVEQGTNVDFEDSQNEKVVENETQAHIEDDNNDEK